MHEGLNTEESLETRLFINRPYKVIDLMGGVPVEGVVVGGRLVVVVVAVIVVGNFIHL